MYRASDILRNARLDKEFELTEISQKLKTPVKYLRAIETEDKDSFPQEPYLSLIVKDYAHFLHLNGTEILSIFRRDYDQKRKINDKKIQKFSFTPHLTFKIVVFVSILIFSVYLILEYLKFNRPPPLEVNWPEPNSLTDNVVEVMGNTDPESTVRINTNLVIVDSSGSFKKTVYLNESTNSSTIVVEATSPSGKVARLEKAY